MSLLSQDCQASKASDCLGDGVAHLRAGRVAEAEQSFRRLLTEDPGDADGLLMLGVVSNTRGWHGEAVGFFERALRTRPDHPKALYNLGVALQALGRWDEALARYGEAAALAPRFMPALFNHAVLLQELGRRDEALAELLAIRELWPNLPEGHNQLGSLFLAQTRYAEAEACLGEALRLRADYAEALNNRGVALLGLGRSQEAIAQFVQALNRHPGFAAARSNVMKALGALGPMTDAIACCEQALVLTPDDPDALYDLANALSKRRRWREAERFYGRSLVLKLGNPDAHNNLGNVLQEQGRWDAALTRYEQALVLKPDDPTAHYNRGFVAQTMGLLGRAVRCYQRALMLRPDYPEARNNLGDALEKQGRVDDAIACYRGALDSKPDFALAHSNLLMALHYAPRSSNADLYSEARQFARRVEGATARRDFSNTPDPHRRLRLGYVSANFMSHPVGYFLAPVLEAHDPTRVELFCYSNSPLNDAMTARLRTAADHWRMIAGLSDADAAAVIGADAIDILIDLSGHTAGNRLPLFALKPAPVQVTWLGYFGTTGLSAIDYILADGTVVPPGEEAVFAENVWRLPGCYLCYAPHGVDCPVGPFPATANGFVTFGCFNNRAKISAETVAAWAEILKRVAGSRLFLKDRGFADEACRAILLAQFAAQGIGAGRLLLEGRSPLVDALTAYNRVDIALDPFPFGGCTTTAETLWMGVPLVTQRGTRWVGRMSESILAAMSLSDWVAHDSARYVELACRMAIDLPRSAGVRSDLRRRLEASAFCEAGRFTRSLDEAFRDMWGEWCGGRLTPVSDRLT